MQRTSPLLVNGLPALFALVGSLLYLAGILSVIALYGVNFDEGYNLQIPLNLLEHHVYGSRTLKGFYWFDPYISTGPIVLLPVTFSFLCLGKGILQARLISGFYAIAILFVLFLIGARLWGRFVASVSLLLLAITGGYWILGTVLGEGAGVLLVLLGIWVWKLGEERNRSRVCLLAGLLWGLSTWAKPSMVIAVVIIIVSMGLHKFIQNMRGCGVSSPTLWPLLIALVIGASWFIFWFLARVTPPVTLVRQQFDWSLLVNINRNLPVLIRSLGIPISIAALMWLVAGIRVV